MNPSISLVDGVQRHQETPEFIIPDDARKALIRPGHFVKLMFEQHGVIERMWVEVTELIDGDGKGILSNTPVHLNWLRHGESIDFAMEHVVDIFEGAAEEGDESDNVAIICDACNSYTP